MQFILYIHLYLLSSNREYLIQLLQSIEMGFQEEKL